MTGQSKGAAERRIGVRTRAGRRWPCCWRLAIALLALPGAARAQSYVFNSVSIEGNSRIEPATILSYAGIGRGQTVTAGQLNDAYQRLVKSGLFEAVDLVPSGGTLVIRVTEFPTISRINIEGNRRIKDDKLLPLIKSQPRRIYSPDQARADAAAIAAAYEAAGRLAASVDAEDHPPLGQPRRPGVRGHRRQGGRERAGLASSATRISPTAACAGCSAPSRPASSAQIIQRDTYVPERIDFDQQVLRDFYLSRGYVDFKVDSVNTEFTPRARRQLHHLPCQRGAELPLRQDHRGLGSARGRCRRLPEQQRIRSGATYTPAAIDNVIARMEALAERKGLSFVRVDPRVTRHDREGLLDIQFALVRGPRIFVERIDIEGNQTTLDRVIRTQFKTVEGDPFNPRADPRGGRAHPRAGLLLQGRCRGQAGHPARPGAGPCRCRRAEHRLAVVRRLLQPGQRRRPERRFRRDQLPRPRPGAAIRPGYTTATGDKNLPLRLLRAQPLGPRPDLPACR